MGFGTSSVWIKVALICLALGTLLFLIGFATNSWMVSLSYRHGLWTRTYCHWARRGGCETHSVTSSYLEVNDYTAWYRATQVFECLGLICVLLALLIIIIFVFVDRMRKRSALLGIIILSIVGAISMAIGFIIFAVNFENYDVGWSMVLAIIGCALSFVAGVMGLIDLKK